LRIEELQPGTRVIVTWLDAAEIYLRRKRSELSDREAVTPVESEGVFLYVHTSHEFPQVKHLVLYRGEIDGRHVYESIPMSLIINIEVVKKPLRHRKHHIRGRYIYMDNGSVKRVISVKIY